MVCPENKKKREKYYNYNSTIAVIACRIGVL